MLKDHQDAFGHGMLDYLNGTASSEIVERDDGLIRANGGPAIYFEPFPKWHLLEKRAMRFVRGRVLDMGCGAGRHALHLQGKGLDVTGIDNSPLAIEVCGKRGLKKARALSISEIGPTLGVFDTVLLLGGNSGLLGTPDRAQRILKRLHRLTSRKGRIVTTSADPRTTSDHDHLAYHAANVAKGRMPGQMRIRVRYRRYATPWIDFMMMSRAEMESILAGTGWAVRRYLDSGTPQYVAIIEKA